MNKSTQEHPAKKGMRFTILAMVVNLVLSLVKGVAGILGNSYALIADAIESLSDVATSFIVWTGLKISAKAPDQNHPYGHGKAEPFASVLVSLSLLVAGIIIIYQSILHILTPHDIPEPFTLVVLILVIITKEILFKKVVKVGEETQSTAVKSDAWHHRSDAITSLGTFLGISIALLGGKGYESADDWAAIITSGFIIFNAIRVAGPAVSEIMDEAAPPEQVEEIKKTATTVKGVMALDKCLVRKMGFDLYVDIHVVVEGSITVKEGHDIAHEVQTILLTSNPRIKGVIVHIEPFDPEYEKKKTFL